MITIKNQNFGVEIEFTGITRKMAADVVAKVLGSTASNPECTCYRTRRITDSKRRVWKVMRDSSVMPKKNVGNEPLDEYKCEMVTPICQYGDIDTLQEIVRALKAAGACIKGESGIHIHIDGSNHDKKSILNIMSFVVARQDLVNEALGNQDRLRWCRPISENLLKAMKRSDEFESIWYSRHNDGYRDGIDHSHYNPTRYHGLNLHAYFTKGTVEFRLFNSTLHAGKLKAYIQFCLALSTWAINAKDQKVTFRGMNGYTAEQKVEIMKNILTKRLGLTGEEFKTCRIHMTRRLKDLAQANVAA